MTSEVILIAAASLVGLGMIAATSLLGWHGWLQLKLRELDRSVPGDRGSSAGMARIELADLKERIRKLEAIAAGVDL